jgi:hypothetical protein
MIKNRAFVIFIPLGLLSMTMVYSQDLSKYREYQLGMDVATVAKHANTKQSDAKVVYQRPVVIQELHWRPVYSYSSVQVDPVREVLFSFYNGELYRIVVNYDQDKTEGLTDEDMIGGISAKYGTPTMPAAKIISSPSSQLYSDSEEVIARWEDSQHSLNFFRFSYGSSPGMLVFSKRLDALAQTAIVEAIRLNEKEAPQREADRKQKQDDEKAAKEQKARPVNKANFRP